MKLRFSRKQFIVAFFIICCLLLNSFTNYAQQPSKPETEKKGPIEEIKDYELNHSQVMEILSYLTNVIGPRLTASPAMKEANDWTRDWFSKQGLQNAHLETWGPFGRGWTLKNFSAQIVEPQVIPLIAYPKAWSPSLKGTLTSEIIYIDAKNESELEKYKGKLKGAIVMNGSPVELKAHFTPEGSRLTEKELLDLANAPDPKNRPQAKFELSAEQKMAAKFRAAKYQFFLDEEVALLLEPSSRGDGGTLFVQGAVVAQPFVEDPSAPDAPKRLSPWDKSIAKITPQLVVSSEHYNRMVRMIGFGKSLKLKVELETEYQDKDLMGYNTIAEIPGTDLKDEIVMLGAHLDSWHSGTGATDNGAGVAVVMEVVRILQALNLKPRRTIRIGLWTGEEQGLFGSRAYVTEHFAQIGDGSIDAFMALRRGTNPQPEFKIKPEYEKFNTYFNLDNGTGKIRGIYLEGNETAVSVFRQWLAPFNAMGAATLSMSNTGGTDHISFNAIGLPGFQFIQDEIEYDTRTHHSNQDVFDRIQAEDMKQNAAIMAAFVYNAATSDEKIPRKPFSLLKAK